MCYQTLEGQCKLPEWVIILQMEIARNARKYEQIYKCEKVRTSNVPAKAAKTRQIPTLPNTSQKLCEKFDESFPFY